MRVGSHPLSIFSPRLYHCVTDQAVAQPRNSWKGSGTPETTQPLPVPSHISTKAPFWVNMCPYLLYSVFL